MKDLDVTDWRNAELFKSIENAWSKRIGPRVGDFVKMPDGSMRRFSYRWCDSLQVTPFEHLGSFFIGTSGFADYSGTLDPSISKSCLGLLDENRIGTFWTFDRGIPAGGGGRKLDLICRVYVYLPRGSE